MQRDLARAPGLVEERFERAVEAQDREPALARHRLHPVAPLDTGRLRRSEVERPDARLDAVRGDEEGRDRTGWLCAGLADRITFDDGGGEGQCPHCFPDASFGHGRISSTRYLL